MKILYISTARIPSKTANSVHIMKMCQALTTQDNEVHLIAMQDDDSIDDIYKFYNVKRNFNIHFFDTNTIKYLFYLNRILNKIKPDLVYGRYLHGCTIASIKGYKTIYEVHSLNFADTMLSKISLDILKKQKFFYKLISITHSLKKDILYKYLDLEYEDILVLPDGADLPDISNIVNKLQGDDTKLQLGYVGSMHKGKGVEIVVEIAKELPDFEFHIVGGKEKEIEYWKSKYNLDNLYFYGFVNQSELKNYISYFDICLLPNQKDVLLDGLKTSNIGKYTSPLKMFEYMSYKKAIIASDIDVIKEILNDSNSILVRCDDTEKWKQAILELKNKNIRDSISQNGYNDLYQKYSWDCRIKRLCL